MLPLVLELGKNVSPEDYPSAVLAPLIKLFASPDRGMRMALLDHLPDYADKLDKKATVDKIWPHLVRMYIYLGCDHHVYQSSANRLCRYSSHHS